MSVGNFVGTLKTIRTSMGQSFSWGVTNLIEANNDGWLVGWCRWCSACVMMGDLQDFSIKHNGYSSFSIVLLILRGTWSVFVFWPFKSLSLHFSTRNLFHDCFSMLNSHPFVSEFHATYWFRSSQDPRPSRIARMPCGRCLSNEIFLGPKLFHLGYGSRLGCKREHQHDHIWYWRIQLPIPILPPRGPVVLFLPASHSVTIAIHLQYNSLQTYS